MQIKLKDLRFSLLRGLVFAAPMSFLPSIAFPLLNFPSFRIGLYQVLSVAFVICCLPLFAQNSIRLLKNRWFLLSASLIALSVGMGLLTTASFGRTLLYSASLIALLILGIAGYLCWKELRVKQIEKMVTTLLWSGVVFGGLALLQLVIASFDRTALGTLCTGCSDAVFGFPRINVFAAEPQFFANSLLPALFASFFFRKQTRLAYWSLILSSIAIGLTFSRGAFLAIIVSILAYSALQVVNKRPLKSFLMHSGLMALGILTAFVLLVGSATIRYRNTPHITFNTTVSMLEHLSMGKIAIPQKPEPVINISPVTTSENSNFTPEGFVEASSNDRLEAAALAMNAWNDSPKTTLFGVGMGNLGTYVNSHITEVPPNLTVYIWYILVLAELGLVGLVGLLIAPYYLLRVITRSSAFTPVTALAFTVTVGFLVQLISFGSYINVMYQYLFVGIFISAIKLKPALRIR